MSMRVGILGAGISGIGAALLAKSRGYDVWVSDDNEIKEERKRTLTEHQVPFEERGHHLEKLLSCDVIVKSPGHLLNFLQWQWLYTSSKSFTAALNWSPRSL